MMVRISGASTTLALSSCRGSVIRAVTTVKKMQASYVNSSVLHAPPALRRAARGEAQPVRDGRLSPPTSEQLVPGVC